MTDPLMLDPLSELARQADGLLMPSESDAPFSVFRWEAAELFSVRALLRALDKPAATPVATLSLERFFAPLVREADWHDADDRRRAERFRALLASVQRTLRDPLVYRVGSVEVAVYIVGRTEAGAVGGLQTTVVET